MTATMTAPAETLDLNRPLPFATFSITASRAAERAAAGELVPWQGVLAVEGVPTGDQRIIELGALRWANLPLPLMAQFENPVGGMGHDGAVLAGRIDDIVRIDENRVWARGFIDPAAPGGPQLINALDKQLMRGVSVDLDDITVASFRDGGKTRRAITDGRIRGATVTPFQAIVEAEISLDTEALAASGAQLDVIGRTARITTPISPEETLIEMLSMTRNTGSLVASAAIPVDPPLAWFEKRKFNALTPLTITANGQVFGHIAAWGTCHISFRRCEPVPRSTTNYSEFRTGTVLTADGVEVRTGPLIMDSVHPDLMMRASDAQAFYAHTGSAVADIIPYEDEFGIAVVGAIRPEVTPQQLRALRGSDISPDWRTVNGRHRECVAMLAVNNSGFKVPQTLVASGGRNAFVLPGGVAAALSPDDELLTLVASGGALQLDRGGCDQDADDTDPDQARIDAEWRDRTAAMVIERFGPKIRTFRCAAPRRVRTFGAGRRLAAEFHAQHNQKTHGNRAGAADADTQKVIDRVRSEADQRNTRRSKVDQENELRKQWFWETGTEYEDEDPDIRNEVKKGLADTLTKHPERDLRRAAKDAIQNSHPSLQGPQNDDWIQSTLERAAGVGQRRGDVEYDGGRPRRFRVASHETMDRMAEFHAQHDQKTHGNRAGATGTSDDRPSFDAPTPAKPNGGGEYSTDRTSDGRNYQGRPVPRQGAFLQNSTRLTGPLWQVNKHPGDAYDTVDPDVMVVETTSGRQRAFIKPTGKIVKPNRTRPSLYEYDMFEVDTVGRTNPDGRTAAIGRPGKFIQKMYANSEVVDLERE